MRKLIVSSLVSLDRVSGDPQSWASAYFEQEACEKTLAHNLVDELDFWIHPTVLEHETPLFRPGHTKALRIVSGEERSNGVLSLLYSKA